MVKICKNCEHPKSYHKFRGYVKEMCTCDGWINDMPPPAWQDKKDYKCDCTQFIEWKRGERK